MTQLVVTALAMVNAPAADVQAALRDYREVRPQLLPPEFGGYEVVAGGLGQGTEVRWNLALDEAIRNRKGKRPRPGRHAPREFVVEVEEPETEPLAERETGFLVERDSRAELVVTWTLRGAEPARTAVQVNVTWEHGNGLFSRQNDQFALRIIYEGLLTKLHDYFEPDEQPSAEPDRPAAEPDSPTGPGPAAGQEPTPG